ncbi:MAG: hypothetical protein J2P22_14205 [Nocardioides sp.]|nr:hypothetical protein [Nocardioides sp.]
MRRSFTAAVVALSTALSAVVLASSATADPSASPSATTTSPADPSSAPTTQAEAVAQDALQTATQVLHGNAPHVDATAALLQLRLSMNALPTDQRRQAAEILARPTDHPDPIGEDYTVRAKRKCSTHICIHWVPTTADAPPSMAWVNTSLRVMNHVWTYELRRLGYHQPISDGRRGGGGTGRFDVYLKELTDQGLYGLTVAERRSRNPRLYSSYMIIDNDFKGYTSGRMTSLRVTAAHEFFHAIQYAYDVREDTWMKEATATWMEEQFDDPGNDNRQYLPYGQINHPGTPLDALDGGNGFAIYGNWLFFQYLSQHYGRDVVKKIWTDAASFRRGGHEFSAQAIHSALSRHGGMTSVFARYANGNTVPANTYPEGAHYPASRVANKVTLTQATPSTGSTTYHVKHLASVDVKAVPGADLSDSGWRLQVNVRGPGRAKAPAAVILVKRADNPMTRTAVKLNRHGDGTARVPFSTATTTSVTVTLANASTRFRCRRGTQFSCHGVSQAANPGFALTLTAVHP